MGEAAPSVATLGELRATGWRSRRVKDELRDNLVARLRAGTPLFPGVVGFEESVIPSLERSILAGHDVILLGERGQAKTRLVRLMEQLLDPWMPAVAGCELRSDPTMPVSSFAKQLVAELGDVTPIRWVPRDERLTEKLATPDITVGDLIGDVDPIKVAEGRHLSDLDTIHFGLVPRSNRGIVAVNELPDLAERVQVALLNVLEERDVQIRGYAIRLPLDLMLVATANPDDYTNRGRIISPLKDRFGSQVRTHYPRRTADEIAIVHQESAPPPTDVDVVVPAFLDEVLAELARELRGSSHVNQRSGVSVRYTIGARETMVASAVRRAVLAGESVAVPRIVDLWPVVPAALGRIEFDTLDEGREEGIVADHLRRALLTVFRRHLAGVDLSGLVRAFDQGLAVTVSDVTSALALLEQVGDVEALPVLLAALDLTGEHPGLAASALEFAMEALHLAERVNKHPTGEPGQWVIEA